MTALAAVLLLAASPVSSADRVTLEAATRAVFAPYSQTEMDEAPWDRDIWSREVRQLIAKWQSVLPEDEPDALNDGDWLCQCQDWDVSKFKATIRSLKAIAPDVAEVTVDLDLGFDDGVPRDEFITFRREDGRWLIDEIYTEWHSDGIKAALRQTIAEDEQLRKARP